VGWPLFLGRKETPSTCPANVLQSLGAIAAIATLCYCRSHPRYYIIFCHGCHRCRLILMFVCCPCRTNSTATGLVSRFVEVTVRKPVQLPSSTVVAISRLLTSIGLRAFSCSPLSHVLNNQPGSALFLVQTIIYGPGVIRRFHPLPLMLTPLLAENSCR